MAGKAKGSVWEISVDDVAAAGLPADEAAAFHTALHRVAAAADSSSERAEAAVWEAVAAARVLRPEHPHALHQLVYYSVYARWDLASRGPPPYWFPSPYDLL